MTAGKKPDPGDWVLLRGDKVIAFGKDVKRLIRMYERLGFDDLVLTKEPARLGHYPVWTNRRLAPRPKRPRLLRLDSPLKAAGPRAPPESRQDEETGRKHGRRLTMAHIEKIIGEQYERRARRAGLHLITPGRRTARRRRP